jgi:hypothetical protein
MPLKGKGNLREVGPTNRPDGQEAARSSVRDQLHGRMNFCRETEGTGDLGKSSDREKDPRQNVSDVRRTLPGLQTRLRRRRKP